MKRCGHVSAFHVWVECVIIKNDIILNIYFSWRRSCHMHNIRSIIKNYDLCYIYLIVHINIYIIDIFTFKMHNLIIYNYEWNEFWNKYHTIYWDEKQEYILFYFIFKKHSMDTEQFLLIICYLHLKCVHLSLITQP